MSRNVNSYPQITVEFRSGGEEETVKYRDKVTKEQAQFVKRTYNCETDDGVFVLSLPRPDQLPPDYKFLTLKKGTKYRLALTAYAIQSGIPAATGFVIAPV